MLYVQSVGIFYVMSFYSNNLIDESAF